jgi:hypothetical protein
MGAVPTQLVWDNEPAVGSWRAGKPQLAEQFEAFRGTLGISVHQCRPRDPEAKGLVERVNGYFETSFLPGRTFTGPRDFNTQISDWLVRANARHHRSLGCAPAARWAADKAAMLALPPVAPQIGWSTQVRPPRDHYVRLDSNDYGHQTQVIQAAERGQVGMREGSEKLVEVIRPEGVGRSIFERPRPLPRRRRAHPGHPGHPGQTVNCEEPAWSTRAPASRLDDCAGRARRVAVRQRRRRLQVERSHHSIRGIGLRSGAKFAQERLESDEGI